MADTVENAFRQVKEVGKNNLDSLMTWMKDAKLIDEKFTEEKAKMLYEGVDAAKEEFSNFTTFLTKVADEKNINIEEIQGNLVNASEKYVEAAKAGYKAFANTLNEKK